MPVFYGIIIIRKIGIMSIFRKRKIEKIDLPILNNEIEELPSNLFHDDELKQPPLKNSDILTLYERSKNDINEVTKLYYTYKIYAPIAKRGSELEQQLIATDKYMSLVNSLNKQMQDYLAQLNEEENQEYLVVLAKKNQEMNLSLVSFKSILEDIKKHFHSHVKMATLNVCFAKEIEELIRIYVDMTAFLKNYKTLEEAAQYIFYNSGQAIHRLINITVERLQSARTLRYSQIYPTKYFLKSDAIITLTLGEWVELYNKLKFVIKNTPDVNLLDNANFKNDFFQFEIYYLILMINSEKS